MKLLPAKASKNFAGTVKKLGRYRVLVFIVAVGAVYGFVLFEINTLSNLQPSSDSVSSQLHNVRPPKIDEKVVRQLQALQDNSVSVKALFDQSRNNPFEE